MGKVKMPLISSGGGKFEVPNGAAIPCFGSTEIEAASFIETVNAGGGEQVFIPSFSGYPSPVLLANATTAVWLYNNYFYAGKLNGSQITAGTGAYFYNAHFFDVMMNGTRAIVYQQESSGYTNAGLFSINGTSVSQLASFGDDNHWTFTGPDGRGFCKVSESQAISWQSGYSGGYKTYLMFMDISSGAFQYSNFELFSSYSSITTRAIKGCFLNGYLVLVEVRDVTYVHVFTVSGVKLTKVSTTKVSDNLWGISTNIVPISANKAVMVTCENQSTEPMRITTLTLNGSTPSVTQLTFGPTGNYAYGYASTPSSYGPGFAVSDSKIYVACGVRGMSYTNAIQFYTFDINDGVVSLSDSKDVTLASPSQIYAGQNAVIVDGLPIFGINASGTTTGGVTTNNGPAIIRNFGRYEVKPATTKIDGITSDKISPTKSGTVWYLK